MHGNLLYGIIISRYISQGAMFGKNTQKTLKIVVAIIGIGGMIIFTILPLLTGVGGHGGY